MGARIAAHFVNAGVPVLLLDVDDAAARKGLESALKQRPGGFFTDAGVSKVQTGNFDQHLSQVANCDWIIEAVVGEAGHQALLVAAAWTRCAASDAILSTNTSGIPLAKISEGFSEAFRQQFLGTHFFNPPRYLHLVEVIPGPDTDPDIVDFVSRFGDLRLGKGVVLCKDTPNFIANRIGSFFGGTVYKFMVEDGYTVEEVDALTGPLIGLPNRASFRLLDIVGIDVWAFRRPESVRAGPGRPVARAGFCRRSGVELIERGWLGEKSGQGFYRRVGKGADRT